MPVVRRVGRAILLGCCLALPGPAVPGPETGAGWRLAEAASPYLRLHADNPVAWRPWGEKALAAAREANKPLFLSIGYYTCHWCHVMERESFRDPAIAELLNEHYIPVKVDREQHPAIDAAYLRFVESSAGHGGWPLTVLATPEGRPFFGGTYFPPARREGEPGLRGILERFAHRWTGEEESLRQRARQAARGLRESGPRSPPERLPTRLEDRAAAALERSFDPFNGGFGQARKFPRPVDLLFLLGRSSPADRERARTTLDAMAGGAIHDPLGGGFHRYATDPQWRVPHFEKMLYTQALVARAYLRAFERTGERRYAATARRTLAFAGRRMRHEAGGYFAALAAASPVAEGGEELEGGFYTWTPKQLKEALGENSRVDLAAARFGIRESGNTGVAALGQRSVPYRAVSSGDLAERFGLSRERVEEKLEEIRRRLRRARGQRPHPAVDRKVVAAWNGHMITTLVAAAHTLEDAAHLRAARRTAEFIWGRLVRGEDQEERALRVRRSWSPGGLGPPGTAADYAALAEAALALHRATADTRWRRRAAALLGALGARFADGQGGGYYARADEGFWLRAKPVSDNPLPSANSLAARAQLALGRQGGGERWLRAARDTAAWQGARVASSPQASTYLLAQWPALRLVAERLSEGE